MATWSDYLLHIVVILSLVKESSAYCYGYCWWTSWYIWFGIVMVFAIGCGALGSYLRRRRLRQLMRARQTTGVVAVVGSGPAPVTSDMPRPYVYPPGVYNPHAAGNAPTQGQVPPMMVPPPYSSLVTDSVDGDKKVEPPSYGEAVQMQQQQAPPLVQQAPPPVQQGQPPIQPQTTAPYPTQPYPTGSYPVQPYPPTQTATPNGP